jgi:superfamily II DNA or RNA helicase
MSYSDFLTQKEIIDKPSGFETKSVFNEKLFPFQMDCVKWALKKGRAALCQNTGMGKTFQFLEWSQKCIEHTNKPGLVLSPLAVSKQTKQEGERFGYEVNICNSQSDVKKHAINITNYEKAHKFDFSKFPQIACDESGCFAGGMKSKRRSYIFNKIKNTPYRLFLSATPAPNDYMELGEHAEGLGVMTAREMLSMFFRHDGSDTSNWILKVYANGQPFWKWLCSWMIMMRMPSDLGYDDGSFKLPKLNMHPIIFDSGVRKGIGFRKKNTHITQSDRRKARKLRMDKKIKLCDEIISKKPDESWLCWVDLNLESEKVRKELNFHEVAGSTKYDLREELMLGFQDGDIERLVTKPQIAGYGMNWQRCHNQIFFGLSDSWQRFYQAVRRSWRYGQKEEVNIYIVMSDIERVVLDNINRKEKQAQEMYQNMIKHMSSISIDEIRATKRDITGYNPQIEMKLPNWLLDN